MADFNVELTEHATRAFLAATGQSGNLSIATATTDDVTAPLVGDEMEFPNVTGKVIFTIVRRRWRVIDKSDGISTLTIWLDTSEQSIGPADVA